MEGRAGSIPVSGRSARDTTTCGNAAGGRLVRISNGDGAVSRRGGVKLVVNGD